MNRTILSGILIFLALVGICLLGGQQQALAGHGCYGCYGCYGCHGCWGCDGCYGCCHGCYGWYSCHGCWGACYGCYGCYGCCCGGAVIIQPTPVAPPAEQAVPAPKPSESALLELRVPADAKVVINGYTTKSTGINRRYISRGLKPGLSYRYEVTVEVQRDGKTLSRTEAVRLQASQNATLAFDFETAPPVARVAVR